MRRRQFLEAVPFLAAVVHAAPAIVRRWAIITIGNLSRNRYWGESDEKPLRDAICTCTLISGDGFQLLVDPSLAAKADMVKELARRTGLKPDQVTAVFVTHEHSDLGVYSGRRGAENGNFGEDYPQAPDAEDKLVMRGSESC